MEKEKKQIDRRNFLKTVGVAGIGSVLTSGDVKAQTEESKTDKPSEQPKMPQVPGENWGKPELKSPAWPWAELLISLKTR
ncbi:MAG: twin-arginine translocation signal domain-containing protein [Planctomycetota bacterium]|jgi:hypothetical protein